MKCEICGKEEESNESINICLNVGYWLGNFARDDKSYEVSPRLTSITSIYLCKDCKLRAEQGDFLYIDILPKIKEYLTATMTKKLIIDSLEPKGR